MNQFWKENRKILFILFIYLLSWRAVTALVIFLGQYLLVANPLYFGPIPLANFDGVHYLNIAQYGYSFSQQAFFPLFPFLINLVSLITHNYLVSSLIIVHVSLYISLFLFFKLCNLDFSYKTSLWATVFFLLFPTSFFLGNVYSESLFLALLFGSFYSARKKRWILAGIFGGFASATRLIGIFILPALLLEWIIQNKSAAKKEMSRIFVKYVVSFFFIPVGLMSYMFYLWKYHGDALLFIHSQPDFGANRTGGELIFLPQVIIRYIKIFLSVPLNQFVFWVAILEFSIFFMTLFILFFNRKKIRSSYLLFSVLAIISPSLTGTLSSAPRYLLATFPLFMVLGDIKKNKIKMFLLIFSGVLLIVLTMYFTRGHFVA